ncbi:MAG: T9SS type A sorting domain-containing protein, partial [Leadbetterella sp.]|nr:T9SS type A sorting domain-containing protein [Leadbetterella sp.]
QESTARARKNMIAAGENRPEKEEEPEVRISVSPNPASDKVKAEVFLPSGKGELTLTDFLGNVLIRKAVSSSQSVQQLDISSLAPGIYVVRVNDGKKDKTVRLVKENL